MATAEYITKETLSAWLKDGCLRVEKDFVIIDVRDDDRTGGHIKSSKNMPSKSFHVNIDSLLAQYDGKVKNVIFHCMMSQVRGPSCANKFIRSLSKGSTTRVHILKGGFHEWQSAYGNDTDLTEAYDNEGWKMNFYD